MVRWMTAFDTTEADVDAFLSDIRSTAGLEADPANVSRVT